MLYCIVRVSWQGDLAVRRHNQTVSYALQPQSLFVEISQTDNREMAEKWS